MGNVFAMSSASGGIGENLSPFAVQSQWAEGVRLITTAVMSIGIIGAAIYEQLFHPDINSPLIGWAGTVVGVFVGHQVAQQSASRATGAALAAAVVDGASKTEGKNGL